MLYEQAQKDLNYHPYVQLFKSCNEFSTDAKDILKSVEEHGIVGVFAPCGFIGNH